MAIDFTADASQILFNTISAFRETVEDENKQYFTKLVKKYISHIALLLIHPPFNLPYSYTLDVARGVILCGDSLEYRCIPNSPQSEAIDDLREHLNGQLKDFTDCREEYFQELIDHYVLE